MHFLVLILSFYLLAIACDRYFVGSLDKISERLKLSSDVAGATLMAVGSSAPEFFVVVFALFRPGGHGEIGAGTIVGSALFNVLVIIGAAAIVKKAVLTWQPVVRDTLFYVLAISALLFTFQDGRVVLWEAGLLLGLYIAYIIAVVNRKKLLPYKDVEKLEEIEEKTSKKKKGILGKVLQPFDFLLDKIFPKPEKYISVFLLSILVISGLSYLLVESAVHISVILNIPASIIALTVLAAGTSIPDLLSSMVVAKQGRGDMAISNAIGSNIFDILFALGAVWFFYLLFTGGEVVVSTENLVSSVILLFATVVVIFFLLLVRKWKIGHRAGYFLIALYLAYVGWAIMQVV